MLPLRQLLYVEYRPLTLCSEDVREQIFIQNFSHFDDFIPISIQKRKYSYDISHRALFPIPSSYFSLEQF